MNRNNFVIHLALALVLILVAAFAGQLTKWRKQWKPHIVPTTEKKQPTTVDEIALNDGRNFGNAEVLVKFKSGVAEYSKLPEVEYAEPNYEIKLEETVKRVDPVLPHDPQFEDQWALSNS